MLVIVHILNVSLSLTSLPVRLGRKGGWLKKVENHGLAGFIDEVDQGN